MYSLDFCLCLQIRGEESQNQESVNVQQCKRVTFDVCLYFIYMKLIHRVRLQIGSNWSGEGGNRIMYLLGNDRDGCNLLADDCASDCETLKKNCFVFLFFGWTCKCSSIRVCKAYEAVCVCVSYASYAFYFSPKFFAWSGAVKMIITHLSDLRPVWTRSESFFSFRSASEWFQRFDSGVNIYYKHRAGTSP